MPSSVRPTLLTVVLVALCAVNAAAQEAPPEAVEEPPPVIETTRVVIPVAGSVPGVNGIQWRTDVALTNPTRADLEVILTMPALPNEPFFMTTIPAGQTVILPDISRQAFGTAGRLSPLEIHTFGPVSVSVAAEAFPIKDGVPGIRQPIPVSFAPAGPGLHQLGPVTFTQQYRTNVGFVNLGETETTVMLAVQRVAGRNLAATALPLPPRSIVHAAINGLFPLLPESDNLTLIAEIDSPNVDVYASVIHNETHQARFVLRTPFGFTGTR